MLSLGTLEAKGLSWSARDGLLEVQDSAGDMALQGTRHNHVYPLNQPDQKLQNLAETNKKAARKEVWHARNHFGGPSTYRGQGSK